MVLARQDHDANKPNKQAAQISAKLLRSLQDSNRLIDPLKFRPAITRHPINTEDGSQG